MPQIDLLLLPEWLRIVFAAVTGLAFGSFLNVVVHRLPIMLNRQWRDSAIAALDLRPAPRETYNIALPLSHCPSCRTPIRPWEQIPVLSWFWLRGRCRTCQSKVSFRYPAVEFLGGALAIVAMQVWGVTWLAAAYYAFMMFLLALALIDADTFLLPDQLTLPLLWLGLVVAVTFDGPPTAASAVIGAIAGYVVLWLFYWGHKLITRREGMGYGDFKLLAALGAWLGWQALLPIILVASVSAVLFATVGLVQGTATRKTAIPFGPFLCLGGVGVLFFTTFMPALT